MSTQAASSAIEDDLISRADSDFPQSQEAAAFFVGAITALLRLQVPAAGVPVSQVYPRLLPVTLRATPRFIRWASLTRFLSGSKARKQSTHEPLQLRCGAQTRSSSLLDLMGRIPRQTSMHWRLRQVSPFRKSGPEVG